MNCFYCGLEILEGERRFFPLDKPYVNILVHRGCFDAMYDEKYLQDNYQRILDYAGTTPVKIKTKRK